MLTRRGLLIAAPALLISPAHAQFCNRMGFCNPNVVTIDPYWFNVKLLLGFDKDFIDESPAKHGAAAIVGNPQIRSDYSIFGGSSVYFNGTSTLSFSDSQDWNLSNRKFTIEFWYRQSSTGLDNVVGQWVSTVGDNGWIITSGSTLGITVSTDGTNFFQLINSNATAANIWYAVCIDFDGTTYRVYINGVLQKSSTTLHSAWNSSLPLTFGGGTGNKPYAGYIDEFRLTMDIARYASDSGYTVPTQPFPRG
jgi:hypothetical protein